MTLCESSVNCACFASAASILNRKANGSRDNRGIAGVQTRSGGLSRSNSRLISQFFKLFGASRPIFFQQQRQRAVGQQPAIGLAAWTIILIGPNTAEIFNYRFLLTGADTNFLTSIPPVPIRKVIFAGIAFAASMVVMASGQVNAFIYFQF